MNDEDIIGLYFDRSESAISETSAKYGSYCRYIANSILHNRDDADECVNDAFLKAWNSVPPKRPNNFRAFIGMITRSLAINRLEKNQSAKRGNGEVDLILSELDECIPSGSDVEEGYNEKVLSAYISSFLETQTEINRIVFVRRYWYASPVAEIANQLGISESRVKSILFRQRRRLRSSLEKKGIKV